MNKSTATVPLHSYLKKVKSHETVFRNHKSFAEEIAEALLMRARNIANSHPSVVVGKEQRFAEGLINVAEALRESDFPKLEFNEKERNNIRKPDSLSKNQKKFRGANTNEAKIAIEPNILAATAEDLHCKSMVLEAMSPLKTSHIGDKGSSSFRRSWTAVFEEEGVVTTTMTIEKSTFVPLNLPFGTSDAGDINMTGPFVRKENSRPPRNFESPLQPNGCFKNYSSMSRRYPTCSSFGDMDWNSTVRYSENNFASGSVANMAARRTRRLKRTRSKKKYSKDSLSKRKNGTIHDTVWPEERHRDSSKIRRSLMDRLQTFMRKNNFNTFKQRMRSACNNGMREAGDTIGRFRDCVVTTLKK